jgi:outer membrane murein-binding lipoprotein Lpp
MLSDMAKFSFWDRLRGRSAKVRRYGLVLFGQGTIEGGQAVTWEGDLAIGTVLMVQASDGSALPLPQGTYALTTETGEQYTVTVDDTGTITDLQPVGSTESTEAASNLTARAVAMRNQPRKAQNQAFEQVTTLEGAVIDWDGELAVGTTVNEIGADGTPVPANGTYTLELNGERVQITCENGVVTDMQVVGSQDATAPQDTQAIAELKARIQSLEKQVDALTARLDVAKQRYSAAKPNGTQANSLVDIAYKFRNT